MKIKIILLIIIIFFQNIVHSIENKIQFKIEGEIITSIDIKNETKLLTSLNPNLLELNSNEILEIATNSLINQKIKKIEIQKYKRNLEIDEKYINNLIESNYKKLNIDSNEEFEKFLKRNGSNLNKFKEKLAIETLWNEIIFLKFKKNINIDKNKVKNEIFNSKSKKISFNLSEIVFNLNDNENLKNKTQLINQKIIQKGFENTASIYSISSSSDVGGKIGWIDSESLNKNLKEQVMKLKIGEMIKPYVIPGGFLILKLNDIKKTKKNIDLEVETKKIIRQKTNQQLNQFSNIYFNKIKKNITIEKI